MAISKRQFLQALNPKARIGFVLHQLLARTGLSARGATAARRLVGGRYADGRMTLALRPGTWDAWTAHPGHEPETHAFIDERFGGGSAGALFDVGAFCGAFSLRYQALFASIHLFEASARNFETLERNVRLNPGALHPVHAAVASEPGTLKLYLAGDDINSLIGSGASEDVRAITLDDYWTSIDRPAVAFLKIDVEGAEIGVIEGATQLLAAGCAVMAEANDDAHERALTDLMGARGYRVAAKLDGRNMIFEPAAVPAP